ncbi:LiaF domain-containing protein [Alkaliphilus metalliredigens]|nr:LiaF domain-containing protein [Alkaliphilus metalliredigens]
MSFLKSRWIVGVLIIFLGVIALLNNFGFTELRLSDMISTYWPILLVLWGIDALISRGSKGEVVSGLILVFLGVTFIGRNLDLFYLDLSLFWNLFWPVIIILVGVSFLKGSNKVKKSNMAIMGGIERKRDRWDLESSSYFALMGGVELDLTLANIPDEEVILDLTAIMGGIDIWVPDNIQVICEGTSILGGIELLDRATGGIVASTKASQNGDGESKKCIKIYSRAIMGGISVQSKKNIAI